MAKEAYYFSHDSNARNDIKILRLRRQLGLEGYAIYFCIIEMLREQSEYKMPLSNIPDIAFDINTSEEKVNVVINNFDLFTIEDNLFFSARLLRTMEIYNERKTKLSDAGKRGAKARLNGGLNNPQALKERKGKENKGKEKKEDSVFTPPPLSEVVEYFLSKGYTEQSAKRAFEHYNVAGWKDVNGKPVANWKQKMNTVWFKPENKQQQRGLVW